MCIRIHTIDTISNASKTDILSIQRAVLIIASAYFVDCLVTLFPSPFPSSTMYSISSPLPLANSSFFGSLAFSNLTSFWIVHPMYFLPNQSFQSINHCFGWPLWRHCPLWLVRSLDTRDLFPFFLSFFFLFYLLLLRMGERLR